MIELGHHLPEPTELTRHRTRNPGGNWDDLEFAPVRPVVRRQLNLEQEGLCVYCEAELGEDAGHVEHIKPKWNHPERVFEYSNLAHSCDGPKHCGHHKGERALAVEPRPGCNRFFSVMTLDGRIAAARSLSAAEAKQAEDTVSVLGLNSASLSGQRREFAKVLLYLQGDEKTKFLATIPFRWVLKTL